MQIGEPIAGECFGDTAERGLRVIVADIVERSQGREPDADAVGAPNRYQSLHDLEKKTRSQPKQPPE